MDGWEEEERSGATENREGGGDKNNDEVFTATTEYQQKGLNFINEREAGENRDVTNLS